MPKNKIHVISYGKEIIYSGEKWSFLQKKRGKALNVMEALEKSGIHVKVYGSVARGDVTNKSDIDIIARGSIPSYRIELALEAGGFQIIGKEIIQATPGNAIKAYIYLSDEICISFFLTPGNDLSYNFYKFGGALNFNELKAGDRTPGVNKNLILIIPNNTGHKEVKLSGNEKIACELLGVGPEILKIRNRVLKRRGKVGRTGVFLEHTLNIDQSFEEELKKIADKNPAVRKKAFGM
ncbi:MAG: nucleotidyltransferase domain-containing protein [Promethearchaeota archaeon]